jgi:hypothetical protein
MTAVVRAGVHPRAGCRSSTQTDEPDAAIARAAAPGHAGPCDGYVDVPRCLSAPEADRGVVEYVKSRR